MTGQMKAASCRQASNPTKEGHNDAGIQERIKKPQRTLLAIEIGNVA
jgi:hypothetical protein